MNKLMKVMIGGAMIAGCASVPPVGNSGTHFVKDVVQPAVDKGEYPGAISYLYDNGRTEIALMGYSDVEKKRPVAMNDMFQQCSQTKGFCGVCIAKLIEDGKIKLDDPVSKYLPEFGRPLMYRAKDDMNWTWTVKKTDKVITIRDVMNHTAGFPFELPMCSDYYQGGGWLHGAPVRARAAAAVGRILEFEPGTRSQYSNTGIDVGAAVVEVVTGMPWDEYLKKNVLDPLGMKDTTFKPTKEQLKRRMYIYECKKPGEGGCTRTEPSWAQEPFNGPTVFPSAGAGIWTTADDQIKFYSMLMNLGLGNNGVRILKEETVKEYLAKDLRPAAVKDPGYSLGLWADASGNGWFGHGGAWGTNCSINWKTKQLKLWVCQTTGPGWEHLKGLDKAQDAFFDQKAAAGNDAYTGRLK